MSPRGDWVWGNKTAFGPSLQSQCVRAKLSSCPPPQLQPHGGSCLSSPPNCGGRARSPIPPRAPGSAPRGVWRANVARIVRTGLGRRRQGCEPGCCACVEPRWWVNRGSQAHEHEAAFRLAATADSLMEAFVGEAEQFCLGGWGQAGSGPGRGTERGSSRPRSCAALVPSRKANTEKGCEFPNSLPSRGSALGTRTPALGVPQEAPSHAEQCRRPVPPAWPVLPGPRTACSQLPAAPAGSTQAVPTAGCPRPWPVTSLVKYIFLN